MNQDHIDIRGIRSFGRHGVFNFEKNEAQEFSVDISLNLDLQKASHSDDLLDTVDYGAISTLVEEEIEGPSVDLIERLAGRIADRIKNQFPTIVSLAVTVHKPHAPVHQEFSDISVTVHR